MSCGDAANWHTVALPLIFEAGEGFTTKADTFDDPRQVLPPKLYCGVIVTATPVGELPVFTAMNEGISPVPLAERPMPGLPCDQVYEVALPVKCTALVIVLLQMVWLTGCINVGFGLTVRLKVFTGPVHPFKVEFTITLVEMGVKPALTGINAGRLPLPEVPKPISWVLLQLKAGIPPLAVVENIMLAWFAPLQSTSLLTAFTEGVGFTVIVKLIAAPSQPDPLVEK